LPRSPLSRCRWRRARPWARLRPPGAIVSAQYKEIKGWKLAAPRDDLAKGEW